MHVYNFSTGEVEAGGSGLTVNLSYVINSRPVWPTQNPVLEHKRKASIEVALLHPGQSLVCSPFPVSWKSRQCLYRPISSQPPSPPLKCCSLAHSVPQYILTVYNPCFYHPCYVPRLGRYVEAHRVGSQLLSSSTSSIVITAVMSTASAGMYSSAHKDVGSQI